MSKKNQESLFDNYKEVEFSYPVSFKVVSSFSNISRMGTEVIAIPYQESVYYRYYENGNYEIVTLKDTGSCFNFGNALSNGVHQDLGTYNVWMKIFYSRHEKEVISDEEFFEAVSNFDESYKKLFNPINDAF